jgi:hypothetical protein
VVGDQAEEEVGLDWVLLALATQGRGVRGAQSRDRR